MEATHSAWVGSSVLVGAATGLRASSGIAAICLAGPSERLSPFFRRPAVRTASALMAVGELVGDKLPSAPARTEPSGLVPRTVLGGVSAWQLSRATSAPTAVAGVVGSVAAVGAAFGGLALRQQLTRRLSPIPAAVIEDAVCAALAAGALWLSRRADEPTLDDPRTQ